MLKMATTIYKSQYPHIYKIIKSHKDDLEYAELHKRNMKNINHTFILETLHSLTKTLKYYNDELESISKFHHYRSYVKFCIYRQNLHKLFSPYVSLIDKYLETICETSTTIMSTQIMQEIIKSMVWIYKYKVHFRETPKTGGIHYQELMNQIKN